MGAALRPGPDGKWKLFDSLLTGCHLQSETPAQAPLAKKPAQPLVPSSGLLIDPKASSSKESLSPSGNLGTNRAEEWSPVR